MNHIKKFESKDKESKRKLKFKIEVEVVFYDTDENFEDNSEYIKEYIKDTIDSELSFIPLENGDSTQKSKIKVSIIS